MMIKNTCVTFGTFEFVHRGHRKIAETVVDISRARGLTSVVVSFEKEGKVYTTEEEKEYLLKAFGVEMVLSFGEIGVEQFLSILMTKVVVVGENCEQLEEVKGIAEKLGIELVIVPSVKAEGKAITTELVEEAFGKSDFEEVNRLCGHPYIMIGKVVHGKALGRTENMPTANIEVEACKKKPNDGVYCTKICLGEENLVSVTNIGTRPSVDDFRYVTIEALILDFDREIYGEKLVLEVHRFIRSTMKFENLAEVRKQVEKDIVVAKGHCF